MAFFHVRYPYRVFLLHKNRSTPSAPEKISLFDYFFTALQLPKNSQNYRQQ
jgi:hypothetical protein